MNTLLMQELYLFLSKTVIEEHHSSNLSVNMGITHERCLLYLSF